ncbi:neuropeptide FF receptor 2-like [Montipora capricornis]|uniref:neuropeptide FF receptor 2-like n=1 Tax=Montipora capricornis TaxID=246305 RepID=UPI0035F12DF7
MVGTNLNSNSSYYIQYLPTEAAFQASSLIVIMLVAITANTMNIIVVYRNSNMQTPRYMFIMNLAVGDLGVTLLSMPFSLVTCIARKWIMSDSLCKLHGFLGSFFFCVSIFTLTIMSIEQYQALVRPLSRSITIKRAWYMIASMWIISAMLSMGPLLGWGHFDYNSTTLSCGVAYPVSTFDRLYLLILVLLAYVIPLLSMAYAYMRILFAVRKHTDRISRYTTGGLEVMRLQRRITYTLLLVLLVFLLCWLPFVCLIVLATRNTRVTDIPYGLGVAAYWCGFFNSSVNPIIFVIRNDRFREGYRDILREVWYGFQCKRPPELKTSQQKKTCYVDKYSGEMKDKSHVMLRAKPFLTPVQDVELISDHNNEDSV